MNSLVDDFNELEIEEWGPQSDPFGRIVSEVARGVLSHSKSSLLARASFVDYPSFLSYAQEYEISMIPEEKLVRGKRLGSGATMTVYEGKCPSQWGDRGIAIKAMNLSLPFTKSIASSNTRDLRRQIAAASLELRVLSDTNLRQHPNIVDLLGVSWETVTSQNFDARESISSIRPLLLVEQADPTFPTMRDYVDHAVRNHDPIPFQTKHKLLSDVADALADLHSCSVIHGDIKPENILLFREYPSQNLLAKLSDFGGCYLPVIQADGTITEEIDEPKIMGTTYWNAPECLEPLEKVEQGGTKKFSRDYYCMGLLIYYVLFEELPFGSDEDLNDEHMESINAIKNDEDAVIGMVKKKMTSWWKLEFDLEALKELSDETNFVKRHVIFERNLKVRKLQERFGGHGQWSAAKPLHYSFYFAMWQFLQRDPSKRDRCDLLRAFRAFTDEIDTAMTLRDIYLMDCWSPMWGLYMEGSFSIWDISILFDDEARATRGHSDKVQGGLKSMWVTRRGTSYRPAPTYDPHYLEMLPVNLRPTVLRELASLADNPATPNRADYLLSLDTFRSFQVVLEEHKSRNFVLEAAQLGSELAQLRAMAYQIGGLEIGNLNPLTRCRWTLNGLLPFLPKQDEFFKMMQSCVSEGDLELILRKTFESEVGLLRTLEKKLFDQEQEDQGLVDLLQAVMSGDVTRMDYLLKQRIGSPHPRVNGYELLHIGAEYGQREIVRSLVKNFGCNVDALNDDQETPAMVAALADEYKTLSELQHLGANLTVLLSRQIIQHSANYGQSLLIRNLHYISTLKSPIVETLQKITPVDYLNGQNITKSNDILDIDYPPIHMSLLGDNLRGMEMLLRLGCSPDIFAEYDAELSPLHVAALLRPMYFAILLSFGANHELRTKTPQQAAAIHLASTAKTIPAWRYPRVQFSSIYPEDARNVIAAEDLGLKPSHYPTARKFMVSILVKGYKADINAQDYQGLTALSHTINQGDLELARFLIEELGADINIPDFRGVSCLQHIIATKRSPEAIPFCLEHKVDIDAKNLHGLTDLLLVISVGNRPICKLLIDHGADLSARNGRGQSCLVLALLQTHDPNLFAWLFDIAREKSLLSALIGQQDCNLQTLFHHLAGKLNLDESVYDAIETLELEEFRDILGFQDVASLTALHHTAICANPRAAKFMVAAADRHAITAGAIIGLTPLHCAYATKQKQIIELIEQKSATAVNQLDDEGRTAKQFGDACAANGTVWKRVLDQIEETGRQKREYRVEMDDDAISKIEEANRQKAAPKGGWWKL